MGVAIKKKKFCPKNSLKYVYVKISLFINLMNAYFGGKVECAGAGQIEKQYCT